MKNIWKDLLEIYISQDGYRCKKEIMKNKKVYYNLYSEFYNVNKYRQLKSMAHHAGNRLDHINRVAKLSFYVSKLLKLDYVSCTRGALLHDFFTSDDLKRKEYKKFLKEHPKIALANSKKYFNINEIEEDAILNHMYPLAKGKPKFAESKVVCITDKIVSIYEFFRYQLKLSLNLLIIFLIR